MSFSRLCARVLGPVLVVCSAIVLAAPAPAAPRPARESVGWQIPLADGSAGGWIGSYQARSGSRTLYCADPLRRGPGRAEGYAKARLVRSWAHLSGRPVPAASLRRTGWILSRYGSTSSKKRAAAVDTAVYALTAGGDYRWGGRRSEQRLRATGRYAAVKALARTMLVESARAAGTYSVFVRTATVTDEGGVGAVVGVRTGSGSGAPNTAVLVDFDGDARPATWVRTNAWGEAYVAFTTNRPGSFAITARAARLPSSDLLVRTPRKHASQRLFVAGRTVSAQSTDAVVIKTHPTITTVVTPAVGTPGGALRDTVHVSGLSPGFAEVATAELFGPFPSAAAVSCAPHVRARRVTIPVRGNGTWTGPDVRVHLAGYYTWAVHLPGDARNNAAGHRCGVRSETTTQRRPTYRPPVVRAGYSSVGAKRRQRFDARVETSGPRLRIGGVDAPVRTVETAARVMSLPSDVAAVGWLGSSAHVDDMIGTTVVAGHVSDRHDRPGAFFGLARVRAGQKVTWIQGGRPRGFEVTRVRTRSRAKGLPAGLFRTDRAHRLVLISCTGRVRTGTGGFHYTKNVIVVAREMPRR